MKAQRLLSITMLLLNRDCISAPELASRFEVSARTIYRDIESLCQAGIPVVAYPGSGGGYGIMGEFKIDRSLMRPEELGQLTATLSSLSAAVGDEKLRQTADRLKAIVPKGKVAGQPVPENYLFIDLAPAERVRERIGLIRRGIEERRLVSFSYVDAGGKSSDRSAESLAIVFIWQAWYLYAWCHSRSDYRLFKIARMNDLKLLPERFPPREIDLDARPWNKAWPESSPFLPTCIRFSDAGRCLEHFDEKDISVEPSGSALVQAKLPAEEWVVNYLFGLGQDFEVLEPESLRDLVAERARSALEHNS
jgi:predicted DNA-binding transcriptional regulator YafY